MVPYLRFKTNRQIYINMIIGVILRNFKTYKNINYIPLSNGEKFCGLIGSNGIGKSSVLEAIDCYFNNRIWNQNIDSNKSGIDVSYIVPIFLIEKIKIKNNTEIAEKLSNVIWNLELDSTMHPTYKENIDKIKSTITQFSKNINKEKYFLLPLGENNDRDFTLSVFKNSAILTSIGIEPKGEKENDEDFNKKIKDLLNPLKDEIKEIYDYIYIPKDIEPNKLVQLETSELQTLLGENLETIIGKSLSKNQITEISGSLKSFIDDLSEKLDGYKFKTPSSRQPNLKPAKIYSLIIEEFFSLRELHKEGLKEGDGKDLNLKQLSSGEKQQAILSVFHSIINSYRTDSSNLILAVDEPETSLHISACFDQFEKLFNVSDACGQVLFSSHWYGFIPAINNGIIINISRKNSTHQFYMFDIAKYREQIKHNDRNHKIEYKEELPLDIMLKSNNDFIQSIISSIIKQEPYNWLICEGSSEKIYFDEYFKNEIRNKKLRIIPVGGANEIKKVYNHIAVSYDDLKEKINGKIYLVSDTDRQLVEYDINEFKNLKCKRIINDISQKKTQLVNISSNPKSPNTEIEDALNGLVFYKTLLQFKSKYNHLLDFLSDDLTIDEIPSGIALNLRISDFNLIEQFFNLDDNKCVFAKKYVENLQTKKYLDPQWISEIKEFFNKK